MHVGIFNYVEKQRPRSAAFTTSETSETPILDIFVFQDSEGYITREKDIALHFFRECRTHIGCLGTELEEAVLHCSPVKPKFVGLPASHNSAQS